MKPVPPFGTFFQAVALTTGLVRTFFSIPFHLTIFVAIYVPNVKPDDSMDGNHSSDDTFTIRRERMVQEQLIRRGISDPDVLRAMRTVPRHLFMPQEYESAAYDDSPQPIGYGQTISQPFVVASMTEHLGLTPDLRVLEIGTGSAYQTAILAEIAREIYTIEYVSELGQQAQTLLRSLGYQNVNFRIGDGSHGWPEAQPFNAIIVTAAAAQIPAPLVEQLASGARMIIPVRGQESDSQDLIRLTRTAEGVSRETLYQVRFVPLRSSQ